MSNKRLEGNHEKAHESQPTLEGQPISKEMYENMAFHRKVSRKKMVYSGVHHFRSGFEWVCISVYGVDVCACTSVCMYICVSVCARYEWSFCLNVMFDALYVIKIAKIWKRKFQIFLFWPTMPNLNDTNSLYHRTECS